MKNPGPLLVDKVRGYFDRLPDWLRGQLTVRIEHQTGIDAKLDDLDPTAIDSELKQTLTDERETNKFIGDGETRQRERFKRFAGQSPERGGNPETGQVADATETVSATESHLVEGPRCTRVVKQVGDLWAEEGRDARR